MSRWLWAVLLVLPVATMAQEPTADPGRLAYRFLDPDEPAIETAIAGLRVLDGEFQEVNYQRGDSVAEITAVVRPRTWNGNPEVWGGTEENNVGTGVYFGTVQSYLRGDRRFRILAIPAPCDARQRQVLFLPYADTTGIVVGREAC